MSEEAKELAEKVFEMLGKLTDSTEAMKADVLNVQMEIVQKMAQLEKRIEEARES